LGTLPAGCSVTATTTNCQVIFYVVSPTKLVVLDGLPNSNSDVQIGDR
jgi:hypothetical protein